MIQKIFLNNVKSKEVGHLYFYSKHCKIYFISYNLILITYFFVRLDLEDCPTYKTLHESFLIISC